jgi:carbamoyltransferase
MSLWAGVSGTTRNAAVALCTNEQVLGICQQERITRVRDAGANPAGLPDESLDELLARAGRARRDLTGFVRAEDGCAVPATCGDVRLEHHFAHACSAFLPSSFPSARIVICDHEAPGVSVWDGQGTCIRRIEWPWQGPGFAELYSQAAQTLSFAGAGHEQRMEALARLEPLRRDERVTTLFALDSDRLQFSRCWPACVEGWVRTGARDGVAAGMAASLQSRIGDLLICFLADIARREPGPRQLCVGGSLFYNSYFTSRVKRSGLFDDVFVPIDPGNAGLAIGAALHASQQVRRPLTPYLGPSYSAEEIKATLDNCKLSYEWASETDTVAIAADALRKGLLVAWFDGAMEWGPRALGARSILASPFSPYLLENLNRFLKHRESWRGYAVSGLQHAVDEHFEGPSASPFMECDYLPRDRRRFSQLLPGPHASVRVHTVGRDAPPRFQAMLHAFGQASGVPVLVNTSFNGFREPIVCSPRDALRVFFGTGIDMLVFDRFVLRK